MRRWRRGGLAALTALAAASAPLHLVLGLGLRRGFGLGAQRRGLAAAAAWCAPHVTFGAKYLGCGLPEGLRYSRDFVTEDEERELVDVMAEGPWQNNLKSRAQQFFGLVYYLTTHNVTELQPGDEYLQVGRPLEELPSWLLPRVLDTGVFDSAEEINQVAANEYLGLTGISAHVEDPTSFGANLGTLSLLEPVELTLTPVDVPHVGQSGIDHENWIKVLLEPRSFFVLQGESRYRYRHGIRKSKIIPLPDGRSRRRADDYRRISLTFRELLESRRKLHAGSSELGLLISQERPRPGPLGLFIEEASLR